MHSKKSNITIALMLVVMAAALSSSGYATALDPTKEDTAPTSRGYFSIIMARLSTFDSIQDVTLPILRSCRTIAKPLKAILLESEETAIIHGTEVTYRKTGFLPFYTNFWCTGVRLTIEIFADILCGRRDCKKYRCSSSDKNHQARIKKFRENTGRFLTASQELFENQVLLRQRSMFQWTEIALDGSILFLESLYDDEPCLTRAENVGSVKID
jgi:hypothetical protein